MRRSTDRPAKSAQDRTLPKYSIAVASDLAGIPQQQLRRMEESGLVAPSRTVGKTRRYSDSDMERLAEVAALADQGVNAQGIRQILALRQDVSDLRQENADLRQQMAANDKSSFLADAATPAAKPVRQRRTRRGDRPVPGSADLQRRAPGGDLRV